MLGSALVWVLGRLGHVVRPAPRSGFDVLKDPVHTLSLRGVDYVINAIGLINRRINGGAPAADAWLINSVFPRALADLCEGSTRLVHVSTDCVFDGDLGCQREADPVTAKDLYGRSKALGEPRNCLVLRGSFVGPEPRNQYSLMSWFVAQTGTVRGYVNHRWNGMTSIEFAHVIDRIIQHGLYEHGVRHVFGEDITKFDLLQLFNSAFQRRVDIAAHRDARDRDMRLRTGFPSFLEKLAIRPLAAQLADIRIVKDPQGRLLPGLHETEAAASSRAQINER